MRASALRIGAITTMAGLAVASFVVFGVDVEGLVAATGCAILAVLATIDIERRIVPNRIVVPATVAALVVQLARDPSLEWPLAALAVGGVLFATALVYPAGMGMGDVKLAAFLGAWLGWAAFAGLFVGLLAAFLPALAVVATRGSAGRKVAIPFAPFLALGGVVALFAGDALIDSWLDRG